MKNTLDVSMDDTRQNDEKTIKVTGVAADTTKDAILNYFENKRRSGGGEVEDVAYKTGSSVAYVTFVDPNDLRSVLQVGDVHSLDGATLHVSIVPSDHSLTEECRTVEVTGLASVATKDGVTNFFENTRRSGGGETEAVEFYPDKGYALVTFKSGESAQGVVNKENLILDNAKLEVKLTKPAKRLVNDTRRLLVKGLSEKTTQGGLESYMEVVSGFIEVSCIDRGCEPGSVLVTFAEEYDYNTITEKSSRRKLDGKILVMEKIPVCDCIQVTGLNPKNTTEDSVRYYFESPKNGGGEVRDVKLFIEQGFALIYFEDPQVVSNVLTKCHAPLNGAQLRISEYIPSISKVLSPPDDLNAGLKQEISVDPKVMPFILEHNESDLARLRNKFNVSVTWKEGSESITLLPLDKTPRNKDQVEAVCKEISSFLNSFASVTIPVMPSAWDNVIVQFKKSGGSKNANVNIQYSNQKDEITVIGSRQDVDAVVEELQMLKTKIEKEVLLAGSEVTKVVNGIPRIRLKFLRELDLDKKLGTKYDKVTVTLILDTDEIRIHGPQESVHKATADVWEFLFKMKEESLYLSQNVVSLLKRDDLQSFIREQFKAKNLQAALVINEEDETVRVMGMDSATASKASSLVKALVIEKRLKLDNDQVQLEKGENWRLFKNGLTEKFLLSMKFDQDKRELWLVGINEDVSRALVNVKNFFQENTFMTKVVKIPKGCKRFLVKHREQDLQQLKEKLNQFSTVIKGMERDEEEDVVVSGPTGGVSIGVDMIENLASLVQSQNVLIDKPGTQKALSRNKGKKMLALLENDFKCVIEHKGTSPTPLDILKEEATSRKKEFEYSVLTPTAKNISVFKDDICKRNVQVIVNAANPKLEHLSGVSKAIVDAGGNSIQDECDKFIMEKGVVSEGQVVVTSAGMMSFRNVIHAVGPYWREEATREVSMEKQARSEKLLRYTVSNALNAANTFTSVALPALGTGKLGWPTAVCAKILIDEVLKFWEANPSCILSEIQFTSIDDAVVAAFVSEMSARVGQDPKLRGISKTKASPKIMTKEGTKYIPKDTSASSPVPASADGSNVITTSEGLNLVLVVGNMTHQKVDVIVNSTSSDLNLESNQSAKALSVAAGPTLQQECKAIGQVPQGGIVVTSGGSLHCKHVFHTNCSQWENGKGEQVLRDIIRKSLTEAQTRRLSSIAIPAIGTGNLAFPRKRVAAISFEEVLSFSKKTPGTTLKEVLLVVYEKDLLSVQAFQAELDSRQGSRKSCRGAAKRIGLDKSKGLDKASESVMEDLDRLKPEFTIGNVTVQAECGSITSEVTDAIVTLSNPHLDVARNSAVGRDILTLGGKSIQTDCSSLGTQPAGAIVVTGAGNLQTRKIFHIVRDHQSKFSIKDSVLKCLKQADSRGLTSISLPAIGTGKAGVPLKEASEETLAGIAKFAQDLPTSLHLIRIVILEEKILQEYRSAMKACREGKTGIFSRVANWFGFGEKSSSHSSMPVKHEVKKGCTCLEIFAGTKEDIEKAVEEIQKDLSNNCIKREIEEDAIGKLSKEQKQKIQDLGQEYDTAVEIEQEVDRISVRGDAEDVIDVASAIYQILKREMGKEHTKGLEEFMAKNIQWCYCEEDDLINYDASRNYQIEKAYSDGLDSVEVMIDNARCRIVFKEMKETCLDDGEERAIFRKEIGKGVPLPDGWSIQPKDSSGKEKDVHLVQICPSKNAAEFNRVADQVKKTASITISKIERVQNPGLYRSYVVKKDQMDKKNGSNEKFLFHGTGKSSCSTINSYGFNRSYSGKNGTAFGLGVYFARDASYSTQAKYSPPDPSGDRCLYLARVLVGEYAVGRQGMITPPSKGSDETNAYDSVVDNTSSPSIFVVFYDNQCYPDYLITFK
ncbi:protein mono-ADP-ribosyltransferase PARP14-like [Montipora capricornis]|uniref:protein mono-ADP-ribosyltransferase PARP14-like n=1 Tax=Montipora capricornis TaxID=246305 RepID=UPI0035F144F0